MNIKNASERGYPILSLEISIVPILGGETCDGLSRTWRGVEMKRNDLQITDFRNR